MMDVLQLTMGLSPPHRIAAMAVKQDIGGGLENEAGQIGDVAALATAMEAQEDLLNEVVDLMAFDPPPEERRQSLLIGQRSLGQALTLHVPAGDFRQRHIAIPETSRFFIVASWSEASVSSSSHDGQLVAGGPPLPNYAAGVGGSLQQRPGAG